MTHRGPNSELSGICLRGAESPVLSPLQHVLELVCTNSAGGGEGQTFT